MSESGKKVVRRKAKKVEIIKSSWVWWIYFHNAKMSLEIPNRFGGAQTSWRAEKIRKEPAEGEDSRAKKATSVSGRN